MVASHSTRYDTRVKLKNSAESNTGYASSSDDLAPDEWHHVAVTVDADTTPGSMTVTSYVDYETGKSFTTNATFDISAAYNLFIGVAGGNRVFEGLIDEVRVSSGALSSDAFMRSLSIRSDLTGVWLVDGLSGVEHYDAGTTSYLTGTFEGGVSLSSELPIGSMRFRVAGKGSVKPSASVSFNTLGETMARDSTLNIVFSTPLTDTFSSSGSLPLVEQQHGISSTCSPDASGAVTLNTIVLSS